MKKLEQIVIICIFLFCLCLTVKSLSSSDIISAAIAAGCSTSQQSTDNRIAIDCSNRPMNNKFPFTSNHTHKHKEVGSSNTNDETAIVSLNMRNTGIDTIPPLASLGLSHLEYLDVAQNNLRVVTNASFEGITSLQYLDLQYNPVFAVPHRLLVSLISLKTLKIDSCIPPAVLLANGDTILSLTSSLLNVTSLSIHANTDCQLNLIDLASLFPTVQTLVMSGGLFGGVLSSSQLAPLANLPNLSSFTCWSCNLHAIYDGTFASLSSLRTLNLACNYLDVVETIKVLGNHANLNRLDTLVLDGNSAGILDFLTLPGDTFCNRSFSSSLRRLSIQAHGIILVVKALLDSRCMPNLRSISMGYNIIFFNGYTSSDFKFEYLGAGFLAPVEFVKFSHTFGLSGLQNYAWCNDDFKRDVNIDENFIGESSFTSKAEDCLPNYDENTYPNYDSRNIHLPIPRCLRALQLDHYTNSLDKLSLSNLTIEPPDNNLELVDMSNTPLSTTGTTLSNWYFSGVPKLRVLNASNTKLTGLKQLTLHTPALQVLDISRNDFSSMTIDDFRNMLVIPLPIHTLIMSFCSIRQMHDDTLLQFPNATTIDLSYNRLVSVNFQYLPHGVTLNLSSNLFQQLSDDFRQAATRANASLIMNNVTFKCDCDTITFVQWFQTTRVNIHNKNSLPCDYRGKYLTNIDDVELDELNSECFSSTRDIVLKTVIPVAAVCALSLLAALLAFKYRWHIRWYIYLARKRFCHAKADRYNTSQKSFVCFVDYLGVSDSWIIKDLSTSIETQWQLGRVFLYDRDAPVGSNRAECILDAIEDSNKIVFVIGNDTVALGEQCEDDVAYFDFAVNMACVRRMVDIVLVFKDAVDGTDSSVVRSKVLRTLCHPNSAVTKLEFSQNEMFWNELRELLKQQR